MADLRPVFWLPHLENLAISYAENFGPMELPEIMNLSKWNLHVPSLMNFDISSFCDMIKKMPKLNVLDINFNFGARCGFEVNSMILQLVIEVTKVAVSHGKDVILKRNRSFQQKGKNLKIFRKTDDSSDKDIEIFQFGLRFFEEKRIRTMLVKKVQTFVQNELKSHDVIIVEVKQE